MKGAVSILVLAVALLVLGGCGGGGGSGSNKDFVAEGNQICKEDNKKFVELSQHVDTSDPRAYAKKLAPLNEEDLNRLKGLDPPSDKKDTYDEWISNLEDGQSSLEEAADAGSSEEANNILAANKDLSIKIDNGAKKLGLDQCRVNAGQGSDSSSG